MPASMAKSLVEFFRCRSKGGGRRRWGCLSEAEIAAYVDHAIRGTEKDKIDAHLADCEFCLSQVAFLIRIQKAELPASVPGPLLSRARDLVPGPNTVRPYSVRAGVELIPAWGRVAAAAACLAVVVTVSVRYSRFRSLSSSSNAPASSARIRPDAQPVLQNPSVGDVRGGVESASLAVVFPVPESAVPRNDLQFQWKTVDGALDYEVRVLTAEGDLVWEQKTEGNSVKLPSDVRVETGHKYYLLLRADLPQGKTVESRAIGFSVAGQN